MYINLSTLRNVGEKTGVQGKSKHELLKAILNKLDIPEISTQTPTPPRKELVKY